MYLYVLVDVVIWDPYWQTKPYWFTWWRHRLMMKNARVYDVRCWLNTLRPRQNGRHFADDIFKCIFLNENVWIPIEISLTLVSKGSIHNNPALFQIMVWRRPGDMVSSLTHICVTRPHWVNSPKLSQPQHRNGDNNLQNILKSYASKPFFKIIRDY